MNRQSQDSNNSHADNLLDMNRNPGPLALFGQDDDDTCGEEEGLWENNKMQVAKTSSALQAIMQEEAKSREEEDTDSDNEMNVDTLSKWAKGLGAGNSKTGLPP